MTHQDESAIVSERYTKMRLALKDESALCSEWMMAKVVEVYPNKSKIVRGPTQSRCVQQILAV